MNTLLIHFHLSPLNTVTPSVSLSLHINVYLYEMKHVI